MDKETLQARIDAISWYHEFDFPGGLRSRVDAEYSDFHRRLWKFIQTRLEAIDFAGKSVLDIGCWDGYWSFYAEQHGASRVLATDDSSQNWAAGDGLLLAKDLYQSKVQVDLARNVYEIASLEEKFDVVLFLGVYYHLHAPFYALAKIRQLCHPNTILVIEGDVRTGSGATDAVFRFDDPGTSNFNPSIETMRMMLKSAYFEVLEEHSFLDSPEAARDDEKPVWRKLTANLGGLKERLFPAPQEPRGDRGILICRPFEAENEIFAYPPPFGLDVFDPRFNRS